MPSFSTNTISQNVLEYLTEYHNSTGKIHVGIDLASRVVQVCYYSFAHKRLINKEIRASELEKFFNEFKKGSLIVGFEACGSCHYWARRVVELGHEYRCFTASSLGSNKGKEKTDKIDAFDIYKAAIDIDSKEHSIECKSLEHQLLSNLMTTRASIVKQKVMCMNALRAFMYEQGVVFAKDLKHTKMIKYVNEYYKTMCEKHGSDSIECDLFNTSIKSFITQINHTVDVIDELDKKIEKIARKNETCQLLRTIPGVGYVVSIMLYIAGYNINNFKNAKHFAGFCSIAPHVEGTGGKASTIGVRHFGNRELAGLLYIGAMAHYSQHFKKILENSDNKRIQELKNKRRKVIICALANHIAKCAFAIMRDKKPYVIDRDSGFIKAYNASE